MVNDSNIPIGMERDTYRSVCQVFDDRPINPHNAAMISSGLFISGSDTEIGKTYVGSRLVAELFRAGVPVAPRKPIESGCETTDGRLIPADATAYFHAVDQTIDLDTINPYRFKAALSPPRAAHMEGQTIHIDQLLACCDPNAFTVVEGAGGLMSPIAHDGLNIDLAKALNTPILLVTEDRLGALNQALMMIRCAESAGLTIAAIYVNDRGNAVGDNVNDLKGLCNYPVFSTLDNLTEYVHTLFQQTDA